MVQIPAKEKERLYLIDAHEILYKMYFAMLQRPPITSKGYNTAGEQGITQFIFTLLKDYDPDFAAFVFDSGNSGRNEMYSRYKATRKEMPDALKASIPRAEVLIESFNIPVLRSPGYESDDVIGTVARQAEERGVETVIVSGDKDFHQLVRPGVHLLNPGRGGKNGTEAEWYSDGDISRLGVPASQVRDYLALIGDSSDNVPGVKGIGPQKAIELLQEYGSLENILAHKDDIKHKGARNALEFYGEDGLLSKKLVTIQTDVPIELDLEAARVRAPNYERVRKVFERLEFKKFDKRLQELEERMPGEGTAAVTAPVQVQAEAPSPAQKPAVEAAAPAQPDLFSVAAEEPSPTAVSAPPSAIAAHRDLAEAREKVRIQLYPRLSPEEFLGLATLLVHDGKSELSLESPEVQPYLQKVAEQKGVEIEEIKLLFRQKFGSIKPGEVPVLDERAAQARTLLRGG